MSFPVCDVLFVAPEFDFTGWQKREFQPTETRKQWDDEWILL